MSYHRHQSIYNTHPTVKSISPRGPLDENSNIVVIDESLVTEEIERLKISEGLIRLRKERNQLLQQTDWEITRGLEEGLNIDSLKTYRTALRNLPQQIEAGEITAPTLNDNGMLVFEHWPERTDA